MNPSAPNQPPAGGLPSADAQAYPQTSPPIDQAMPVSQSIPVPQPTMPLPNNYNSPVQPNQPSMYQPIPGPPPAIPKPTTKKNPNSTQNTLQIAEIRDGIVIMNDGSFRAVVMAKAINFDLMSLQEQEAVEFAYQGFLNSLYFPIQIFIHSQLIDLKPYMEKLERLRTEHENMLLAMLIDDYVGYIDDLSQQANIMDKEFYIVIPFFPQVDVQKALSQSKNFFTGLVGIFNTKEQHVTVNEGDLENAKTELRNRVQATLSGLTQCGVQGLPLDTQELIELYYNVYNPDTATYQQLKNFDTMGADVITKGDGQAPQPNSQMGLQQ